MKKPDPIEDEIDRIRLKIYEETKHLTPAQRAERTNKIAQAAALKYGFNFRFVSRAKKRASSAV